MSGTFFIFSQLCKHTSEKYMPEIKSRPLSDLSDDQLIANYKSNGDRQMIGELFRRYYHLIFGACYKRLDNRAESKDATMNIFERMLVRLPETEMKSFNSWIYVVIKNECFSMLRKRTTVGKMKEDYKKNKKSTEKVMEFEGVARLSSDKGVISSEDKLKWAIKQLSDEQQKCIRLFFFDEKSYEQIAKKTKFSEGQVKSYLQNGKRRLKRLLEMQTS